MSRQTRINNKPTKSTSRCIGMSFSVLYVLYDFLREPFIISKFIQENIPSNVPCVTIITSLELSPVVSPSARGHPFMQTTVKFTYTHQYTHTVG